jgi:hypothetical protein
MKQTTNHGSHNEAAAPAGFARACVACGQKVLEQISRAKAAILAQAANELKVQRHALQLAVNEAEALAWQTLYPHLVFPALAVEKVQAVAAWTARQRALLRHAPSPGN